MNQKYKVLVTRRIPKAAIEILQEKCEIDYWKNDDVIPRNIFMKKAVNKDGILCLLTDQVDKKLLDSAGNQLKVVSTMSVGVDHISLDECKKRNIVVGYTPKILTSATAELSVGLLLATSRKIVEGVANVKNGSWGTWKPLWMCGPTLDGSTVGFFGFGRIGQAIQQRLKPFNVNKFIFNSSTRKSKEFEEDNGATFVTFDDLLSQSDFIISCCSLNSTTEQIFDQNAFKKMKKTCIFINIARGGVVNQEDLYQALKNGEIGGAGLDVTTPEPLPLDHPLLSISNCVVTPHIGSATFQTREAMSVLAAKNLVLSLENQQMLEPYFTS